jgi:hypothetical protein
MASHGCARQYLVAQGHIHSERPLQKLLHNLPDWAPFALRFAQHGIRNVLCHISRPAFVGVEGNHPNGMGILTAQNVFNDGG